MKTSFSCVGYVSLRSLGIAILSLGQNRHKFRTMTLEQFFMMGTFVVALIGLIVKIIDMNKKD